MSQLVASLQTSCQQVVFAWLIASCRQVWNKLLTTCYNLVDIVRLVTRLFQQGCYNHDITILLQPCVVNFVTFLLYHDCIRLVRQSCNKSDNGIKFVTSCLQLVPNLLQQTQGPRSRGRGPRLPPIIFPRLIEWRLIIISAAFSN